MRKTVGSLTTEAVKAEAVQYSAGLCIPRHSHANSQLIFIETGQHWSGHSAGGGDCAPGTVRFLPAGEPHENYFPIASRCMQIDLYAPMVEWAEVHGGALPDPGELQGRAAKHGASALAARLRRELRNGDDAAALEIETIALRLLVSCAREEMRRERVVPVWLLRVRELLHENGMERLSLTDLARCAGRHPVQISREFHRYFGCTIGAYVRQVRIARAQSLLAREEMSVAEIALACGFADQSHFTTAFRRLTGVPPRKFRERHGNRESQRRLEPQIRLRQGCGATSERS